MIDEEKIKTWLVEEGFYKDTIQDNEANFHFLINYPADHILDVIQPKNKPDMILIGCATEMSQAELDIMREADDNKKESFIWDIRFSLNRFLLDFELEHPNNVLHRFVITQGIYFDGITKDNLIKNIQKVFRGKLQCIWLIERTFGKVNNQSYNDSMFI